MFLQEVGGFRCGCEHTFACLRNILRWRQGGAPEQHARACYNLLMPGSDLALEKLSHAVRELDSSAGRIQMRLAKAATHLIQLGPQELSDDAMRRMLAGIKDDLTFGEP